MELGDEDKENIHKTIDDEVLEKRNITFRSTSVEGADAHYRVDGELTLAGKTQPLSFDLVVDNGAVSARATVSQTRWGMKPFSALFGTLKVLDEVEVQPSVAVDRLGVEPALDAGRQRAGAVRVERDVLDRLELVAGLPRAVGPLQAVGLGLERHRRRAAGPCRGSWPSRSRSPRACRPTGSC